MKRDSDQTRYELYKPLLFSQIYPDELPAIYLMRLARLNGYAAHSWLIKGYNYSPSFELTHMLVTQNDWTGHAQLIPEIKEFLSLIRYEYSIKMVPFCPICLSEQNYIRYSWHIKASMVCLKHQIWLHDRCFICDRYTSCDSILSGLCACNAILSNAVIEKAPDLVCHMQSFLQNRELFVEKAHPNCLLKAHNLNLLERAKIVHFFIKWQATGFTKWQVGNKNKIKQDAFHAAEALFLGETGFWNFLDRINVMEKKRYFIHFYRAFYKYCPQDSLLGFRSLLESYIKLHWKKPIDKRNSLFQEATIKEHLWIPIRRACQEFGIEPSVLRRAIKNKEIRVSEDQKEKRIFTTVYKLDVQKYMAKFENIKTFKQTVEKLGITKSQLIQLVKAKHLSDVAAPSNECQTWEFSNQELDLYLDSIFSKAVETGLDYIALPKVMKIIGNRVESPLPSVLEAIRTGILPVKAICIETKSIRTLAIHRETLGKWIKEKSKSEHLTIPEAAKLLGINCISLDLI